MGTGEVGLQITLQKGVNTMTRTMCAVLILSGILLLSGCERSVNSPPDFEWYPSTILGYTPYRVSFSRESLRPGHTEFTEEEIIRYAGQYIEQHQELIGADSNALTLIEATMNRTDPQIWHLSYEQNDTYGYRIVSYGTVDLIVSKGELFLVESRVLPVVPVPDGAVVSDEAIREQIIGQKLTYAGRIGYEEYEIKADEEIVFEDLVIFPKPSEETLEIRLCREVVVGSGLKWSLFYDVITGELIEVRARFIM